MRFIPGGHVSHLNWNWNEGVVGVDLFRLARRPVGTEQTFDLLLRISDRPSGVQITSIRCHRIFRTHVRRSDALVASIEDRLSKFRNDR